MSVTMEDRVFFQMHGEFMVKVPQLSGNGGIGLSLPALAYDDPTSSGCTETGCLWPCKHHTHPKNLAEGASFECSAPDLLNSAAEGCAISVLDG
jgi:hypothetical protein